MKRSIINLVAILCATAFGGGCPDVQHECDTDADCPQGEVCAYDISILPAEAPVLGRVCKSDDEPEDDWDDGYYDDEADFMDDDVVCAYTREWDPVCGEDGVTYGNACEAELEGIDIAYLGECLESHCYEIWSPVCGTDGVTYGNDCYAEAAGVNIAYFGECQGVGCEDAFTCAPNEHCEEFLGLCADDNDDCPAAICVPNECAHQDDCGEGQYCDGSLEGPPPPDSEEPAQDVDAGPSPEPYAPGFCRMLPENGECSSDADCALSEECRQVLLFGALCEDGGDCWVSQCVEKSPSPPETCEDFVCPEGTICTEYSPDHDLESGPVCVDDVSNGQPPQCDSDDDCDEGYTCVEQQVHCINPPCDGLASYCHEIEALDLD